MRILQEKLGYRFKNVALLQQALTHSSVTAKLSQNYERLEFLGDRILGMGVASIVYDSFDTEPEGNLSQRFMALVCKETVAEVARSLGLENYVVSESIDVFNNDNVLCDVCEAIIGAVFIDGGAETSLNFVKSFWMPLVNTHSKPPKDAKTRLQEIAHEKGLATPVYFEIGKEGSEHEPIFNMQVRVDKLKPQSGKGKNKKTAEQQAAEKMLAILGEKNGQ